MAKKLYKSKKNKMIFGVCGGFAEFFNIDVTLVRILFVIMTFFKGFGALFYLIIAVIMPSRDKFDDEDIDVDNLKNANDDSGQKSKAKKTGKTYGKAKDARSDEDFDSFFKKEE